MVSVFWVEFVRSCLCLGPVSVPEPRRRFKKHSDSDDDDEFLDRTGAVEERRKRKQTKNTQQIRSYEDLVRSRDVHRTISFNINESSRYTLTDS